MPKYKILKLKAHRIIKCTLKDIEKKGEKDVCYSIDLDKKTIYRDVVEEQLIMDNCAIFDQFKVYLQKGKLSDGIQEWLLKELIIVDFTKIYKGDGAIEENLVKRFIENGFSMKYQNETIHMLPFDKSGNMSRKSRLSFVNAKHLDAMNERLNLGIDFSQISVKYSKYYAYRGLYLSTAERCDNINITEETLIVIADSLDRTYYDKNAFVLEGIPNEKDKSIISYKTNKIDTEKIEVPFDGQGIISASYAETINEKLGMKDAHSFQIRLPFTKGMLHSVDFHGFLEEVDKSYSKEGPYMIVDAFGIERDLKRANIIMTESMFKGYEWIKKFCKVDEDPMKFYCEALRKYQHALYISGTDIPYGHSRVTHLSYQLINTLKLSEKQFNSLIEKHLDYVRNPIRYIEMTKGQYIDGREEEETCKYNLSNWQKALMLNSGFSTQKYVKQQLKNIQVGLMTKLLTGKLVVEGQTRYMVRDLPFMLVNLIPNWRDIEGLKDVKLFPYRFYLPQGTSDENPMNLDYFKHCGMFRSPHLSRNEQGVLAPFMIQPTSGDEFRNVYNIINKYLGHLTGVVMFGNESLQPMALGGADFDGDLVTMIMDEDVVAAIKDGVYQERNDDKYLILNRKETVPYVKIPSLSAQEGVVDRTIPYELIKNTFSERIGLISNAAIEIGQSEYGTKKTVNSEITCAQCTILTGLEIDAAKSGIHPDISALTKNEELIKNSYLEFKNTFEDLKKYRNYHFNNLYVEKKNEKYILCSKDIKQKIEFNRNEPGTYINRLPIIFMENISPKLEIPYVKRGRRFKFPKTSADSTKIENFVEECNKIIDTYMYYQKLLHFIQEETSEENYSKTNFEKLLEKQYDPENVKHIKKNELKIIRKKLEEVVTSYKQLKYLQREMNRQDWHLMTRKQKIDFLCKTMGINDLVEAEWELVLQPFNQGYKALWYLISMQGNKISFNYDELKQEYKSQKKKNDETQYTISAIENCFRNYVEDKETGVAEKLYSICLKMLKDEVAQCELPLEEKMRQLYSITKESVRKGRFFWECFEWEEMEQYIVKETKNA